MKPSIQARMDAAIANATAFNTLFDLLVTTSETAFDVTGTNPTENQWNVDGDVIKVAIVCNDNIWNTCTISIIQTSTNQQVGTLGVNINGVIEETYHTLPRAIRHDVYDYVDAIYEAVEGWINPEING
jgi:hypothetical protein